MAIEDIETEHEDGGGEGISSTLDMFKEHDLVNDMIKRIPLDAKAFLSTEKGFEDFKTILDQYQEQPHLLDPHLEGLLTQLIGVIRNETASADALALAFKYLWLITKVRGYKIVVKKMPHEVKDLVPVLKLLEKQTTDSDFYGSYMLMMWLSIITYMPFNMYGFDVTVLKEDNASDSVSITVIDRIILAVKQHLQDAQSSREMAAYLASKFVTRPDLRDKYLQEFIDYCFKVLDIEDTASPQQLFHKMGVLRSIGLIFKHGKREELLPFSSNVLQAFIKCNVSRQAETPIRKYSMKLIQRLGLSFLRPRLAKWRYQRGSRSLTINVSETNKDEVKESYKEEAEEEDHEIPPDIEDVVDFLLQGLKDKDTVVRWSAAKGIGRVTGRLPRSLADEVIGAILEMFSARESDRAWHGGCLALAELARRGLFLPERIPNVLPILEKALVYDELRGQCSVGANIRDAACYLCWAFARAYHPDQLRPFVQQLANGLLIVALFDREIPCRRAGSAAFQEHVGRQGNFPHGIEILTTVDYFAVGNRSHAFLNLSVDVGKYPEYTNNLIDHLVEKKICHWDATIRELAAKALYNLVPYAVDYMASIVVPSLLDLSLSNILIQRHGSILGVGQVILAISRNLKTKEKCLTSLIDAISVERIRSIVPSLEGRKLFRGLGGEYMKQATCSLIGDLSQAEFPMQDCSVILDHWHKLLEDCIVYVDDSIRTRAIEAFPHLWKEYYQLNSPGMHSYRDDLLKRYVKGLKHESEPHTLGYTAALGCLPNDLITGKVKFVFEALLNSTSITPGTEKWALCRKEAIHSVVRLKDTVGINPNGNENDCVTRDLVPLLFESFLLALNDYTMDRRGDIGAWVREASMQAIQSFASSILQKDPSLLTEDVICKLMPQICRQAVERIDRTRKVAGNSFQFLIYGTHHLPHVPERKKLDVLFPPEWVKDCNWASESVTFDKFAQLLDFPAYRLSLLLGFTYSLGGVSANLSRYASGALRTYLNERTDQKEKLVSFMETILEIFKKYQKNDRVILPLIKSLSEILCSCWALDQILEGDNNYLPLLLNCLRKECYKCSDYHKLAATVTTLCELIRIEGPHTQSILIQLSIFLGYQYPKVRGLAATSILTAFQEYEREIFPSEHHDEIMSILEETAWMGPLQEVRSQRNRFCELTGVPLPQLKKKTN